MQHAIIHQHEDNSLQLTAIVEEHDLEIEVAQQYLAIDERESQKDPEEEDPAPKVKQILSTQIAVHARDTALMQAIASSQAVVAKQPDPAHTDDTAEENLTDNQL